MEVRPPGDPLLLAPVFPIYVLDMETRTKYALDDLKMLVGTLECFDSRDKDQSENQLLLDAKGRRVRLLTELPTVKEFGLENLEPKPDDVLLLESVPDQQAPAESWLCSAACVVVLIVAASALVLGVRACMS